MFQLASGLRSFMVCSAAQSRPRVRVHLSVGNHGYGSKLCKDHIKAVAAKTCNEDDDKNSDYSCSEKAHEGPAWPSISLY